jgi:membrane protein insertase Oxa1/YidC/SpoIIIJ
MQAVTKIMPIFFGVISYGFSAATTIYFLISNVWRIGQQHFVLNKMYEEEHGKPTPASGSVAMKEGPEPPPPDTPGSANGRPGPSPNAARRKKKKRKR